MAVMRAILWLTMLTMGLAVPASGKTELETLRERCAQQDRQIRRLKAENERLREGKPEASPAAAHTTREADSAKPETKTDASKSSSSKASKSGTAGGSGGGTYTVRQGDSFDRIAHKNGTTAEKVAEANNLELTTMIHPGQKLVLPPKGAGRSSSGHTATHPSADSKPSKPAAADDAKPAKAAAHADPKPSKPAARAADDPSLAEVPPPAVPKAASGTAAGRTPATRKAPPEAVASADPPPAAKTVDKKKTHAVKIENEMTYGEFATKHGTDTNRLNDLNGLDLPKSSVLAKGSELYVPGQP